MAYNEELGRRIGGLLSDCGVEFSEKKMFGGLGFMIAGKMCVGIVRDDLMLRLLENRIDEAMADPNVRPMDFTGRPMKGFVFVDSNGFQTDSELRGWLELGIEFGKYGNVKTKQKVKKKA